MTHRSGNNNSQVIRRKLRQDTSGSAARYKRPVILVGRRDDACVKCPEAPTVVQLLVCGSQTCW
uniref:Uncharacterized protein n=1 Tax=Hyaloperonospora arabidopsidis (strain Emoy2) TaxID=559515 RepID=M4BPT3_HYAAE